MIRYAQVEFLWILLFKALTLALGAIVAALPPTDASCVAEVWLVNCGYTLILVPLIIKVAAINRLNHASKRMLRVTLNRIWLMGATALVCFSIVVFLAIWTGMDAPTQTAEYELTDQLTSSSDGSYNQFASSTVVHVGYYCSSESVAWKFVSVAWNAVLLLCCTVLAVQTRKVRQEFRESTVLGLLIYSHFAIALLLCVTFFLSEGVSNYATMSKLRSILYSLDTLTTIIIYFVPKLFADLPFFRRSLGIQRDNSMYNFRGSSMPTGSSQDQRSVPPFTPSVIFNIPRGSSQDRSNSDDQGSLPFTTPSATFTPSRQDRRSSLSQSEFMTIPEEKALDISESDDIVLEERRRDNGLIERLCAESDVSEEHKEELQKLLLEMEALRKENASLKQGPKTA